MPLASAPLASAEGPTISDDSGKQRIDALEQQVAVLAASLNLSVDDSAQAIPRQVFELVGQGQSTEAIRVLRNQHGVGLLEAKRIVNAIAGG